MREGGPIEAVGRILACRPSAAGDAVDSLAVPAEAEKVAAGGASKGLSWADGSSGASHLLIRERERTEAEEWEWAGLRLARLWGPR